MTIRPSYSALLAAAFLAFTGLHPASLQAQAPPVDPALLDGLSYRMIGPFRGGRVTAVAGVPGDPRRGSARPVLYFGSTGGGVWKSTTYGLNYENVSDGFFEVGSIGSIAVAPSDSDVLYVGTGSAGIRSNVSTGRGVYKSTDGAETWTYVGLPEAGQIGALAVHPTNPDLVYAAALGHPFGKNPERGVYRSTDGGGSWDRVLFVSDSTGATDLAMNPNNPQELYAAMWRAERKPWTIISGGTDGGIFKTTDGGDSWTKLTNGLPDSLVGNIGLSLSPVNPQRLYALIEATGGQGGVYRSDDAGQSFRFVNNQPSLLYRPFYYTHITADPNDEETVYVSNEGFFKSTDGGASFERIRTPHGDNHALWIHPDDSDFLFQANDGGVNVSLDGGRTWTTQYNQPTAELYHVVVDNQVPYRVYGEQQDNSTIMVPSLPPSAIRPIDPKQHWSAVAGCETGPLAVHPENPDIIYGGCKGRFSRYNHATGQEKQYWVYPHFNYGHAASEMPYRFQRTAPIEVSPHDPSVIYHASQYVHKTTDEGQTWSIISPDLTANEPGKQGYSGGPITRDITGEEIYSAIYALRESPFEAGVLWVGSNDGPLHLTRDGGTTWTDITPPGLPPGGRVQTIEPSPHAPGRAFVAVYRYMLDDWAPYIYRTDDYGVNWTRLTDGSNGIPADHPTRVVREDPDRRGLLYAGTEFGLFVSFNDGATWQSLQQNLPATPVTDIRVHRKDLVLSTMGRSFWILDDLSPLHQWTDEVAQADVHLFKPRDVYRLRWAAAQSPDDRAEPQYPPEGALLYYTLASDTSAPITLEILDADSTVIRTYSNESVPGTATISQQDMMRRGLADDDETPFLAPSAGLHRVNWDLRHTGPISLDPGESGGEGPMAVPGTYLARLRIGDWSQTQAFDVLIDPRVAADGVTRSDLQAQLDLNLRIRDHLTELRKTVQAIRTVRGQLDDRAEDNDSFRAEAASVIDSLTSIEEALIQTEEGKVGAQLKPMLMRQLTYLYSMTTAADQKPGQDAFKRLADIETELNEYLTAFQLLMNEDLARLNETLRTLGRDPVGVDR